MATYVFGADCEEGSFSIFIELTDDEARVIHKVVKAYDKEYDAKADEYDPSLTFYNFEEGLPDEYL